MRGGVGMGIGGISAISGYSGIRGIYPAYSPYAVSGVRASQAVKPGSDGTAQAVVDGAKDAERSGRVRETECQTCKNRKYVDGSNENDVSFKTPGHIDPQNSAAAVMGHEREHVTNAIAEGNKENKDLVSVSVSLKTSVCPECGRVYVSGGVTNTTMRTTRSTGGSESNGQYANPYAKKQADLDYLMASGANLDLTA